MRFQFGTTQTALIVGALAPVALLGPSCAASRPTRAPSGEHEDGVESLKQTFTYKRVHDLEIRADLYRPDDDAIRPVVLWIHGGALIMGHREWIDRHMFELLLGAGYAIVSIDYRLAPQTKLPAIVSDLEDAFAWLDRDGRGLLGVDPSRIAVMGGSAGGYLTLTAGFRCEPRPRALVAFYGYGDLIGDWYTEPSQHARHNPFPILEAEARAEVAGPEVSDARLRAGDGAKFYLWCRQQGVWPREVSGWDPLAEPGKFAPYMPVVNVTADYPPTLLVHGTLDTDVPYEQSVMMASELQKHGVAHELIPVENAEHGLSGGDEDALEAVYERTLEFLKEHVPPEVEEPSIDQVSA